MIVMIDTMIVLSNLTLCVCVVWCVCVCMCVIVCVCVCVCVCVLQLQFIAFLVHSGYNLTIDCAFPRGYTIAVFAYAVSLIILFGNFYYQTYTRKQHELKKKEL